MSLYGNLENLALRQLAERQQGLRSSLSNNKLSMIQAIEFMSSSGFIYRHGVHSRRINIGEERANKELELSVGKVLRQIGFYVVPDAEQRREILHPPFESFGAVSMDNVVHVDFVAGHIIDSPLQERQPLVEPISA